MDDTARAALFGRGLDDIFDPDLRASIGALIDDVRDRGDDAVCDALRKFDGIDARARTAPGDPREIADAIVSDAVDAALDDAIAHLRRFNEQQMDARRRLADRERTGAHGGREGHADQLGRAVHAVGQGELSERRLPARCAGGGRRRRRSIALVVPPIPGSDGEVDPAVLVVCRKLGISDVFRANGPAGIAALGFGTATFPGSARSSGRVRRPSRSPRWRCNATVSPR